MRHYLRYLFKVYFDRYYQHSCQTLNRSIIKHRLFLSFFMQNLNPSKQVKEQSFIIGSNGRKILRSHSETRFGIQQQILSLKLSILLYKMVILIMSLQLCIWSPCLKFQNLVQNLKSRKDKNVVKNSKINKKQTSINFISVMRVVMQRNPCF